MAGAVGETRVEGLRDLQRALRKVSTDLAREFRTELKRIGEPVRVRAEQRSEQNISNIGARWSLMRIGVTARSVYVAPQARRQAGSPRANLGLLLQREMQAALDDKTDGVVEELGKLLDRVDRDF